MAGSRQLVSPPTFTSRNFGLLSVVQARYEAAGNSAVTDSPEAPYWRNGVTWQDICGTAGTTFDPCNVPGTPYPGLKAANTQRRTYGATPFTVVAELDCNPLGYSDVERQADAVTALTRVESLQVERAFWTGNAGVTGSPVVYPHLAANAQVLDANSTIQTIIMQAAATQVSGSVVLDVVEGIQRLEAQMGLCYNGQITLHVPLVLGETLVQWGLIKQNGDHWETLTGNLVALGAGYTGSGPDGVITPNVAWIYATPPVFAYRSAPETFRFYEMFDRATNTLKSIVERTYVLGFSGCCVGAVPISLGGDITGQPLTAF